MSKIVRLTVNNLLRIRAAEITPDGSLVIVAGQNDQGKSSILNSIAIALSGKNTPAQPIRKGSATGQVILETEELVVTRKFSASGGGSLEVRDKSGARVTSPQAKLDTLVARVTFDPFEFTRMSEEMQADTLRRITGLDFTELDAEANRVYEERTAVNRSARDQEGRLRSMPRHEDAPAKLISLEELTTELQSKQQDVAHNENCRTSLYELNDKVEMIAEGILISTTVLQQKRMELLEAERDLEEKKASHNRMIQMRDEQKKLVDSLEEVDLEPIMQQIRESDGLNAKFRDNEAWKVAHKDFLKLQEESRLKTARIDEIAALRAEKITKTKMPIEGLGFSELGVTYNGLPFAQAGSAVKIRTSLAIARSMNPKLPVMLIRDGSLLDEQMLKLVREEAEKYGAQVWLEVVGDREDATVIIEDGEVASTPAADKKAAAGGEA